MKIVILDKETLGKDIDLSPIQALGDVVAYENTPPALVAERIADADVVCQNKVRLNAENLAQANNLKLICEAATGYDNIDTAYAESRGIALCNVPGYSSESVAQLSVSMALALVTHLKEYRDFVHSGGYSACGVANRLEPVFHDIASMKWGVWSVRAGNRTNGWMPVRIRLEWRPSSVRYMIIVWGISCREPVVEAICIW